MENQVLIAVLRTILLARNLKGLRLTTQPFLSLSSSNVALSSRIRIRQKGHPLTLHPPRAPWRRLASVHQHLSGITVPQHSFLLYILLFSKHIYLTMLEYYMQRSTGNITILKSLRGRYKHSRSHPPLLVKFILYRSLGLLSTCI